MIRTFAILLCAVFFCNASFAGGDANQLYEALRKKIFQVKDYQALVEMKIEVNYMRIPQLTGKLYFKSPDKMRLERTGGLSILPKKNINLTLSNLIPSGQVVVMDAGYAMLNGKKVRVMKIVPELDAGDIVLTKMWIDEESLLAMRTETTTRNDGTVIMEMQYAAYAQYALPDRVTIFMDLKDYKLPKGVTLDYNQSADLKPKKKTENQKGNIQIKYLKYEINKGLSDAVFNQKN